MAVVVLLGLIQYYAVQEERLKHGTYLAFSNSKVAGMADLDEQSLIES